MKQKIRYSFFSFVKFFLRAYFNTKIIIKGFVNAILISNLIFLTYFDNIFINFISPFLFILGFYLLLKNSKEEFFTTGLWIGILWFYWISFSLIYYDFGFFIPLEIFGISIVYALIFLFIGYFSNLFIRAALLLTIKFIHPLGFDWLNFEVMLVEGIFDPSLRGLGVIFLSIVIFIKFKKLKFIAPFLLIFGLQFTQNEHKFLPFDIKLTQTNVSQDIKWEKAHAQNIIHENIVLIDKAMIAKKDVVVLPENAFPLFLNLEPNLLKLLKERSHNIIIIAGALAYENQKSYNSTYVFKNGEFSRYNKFILVPFGEEIPLPKFIKEPINKIFFNGAMDFSKANNYSDYDINGVKIRNAICYEATRSEIYEKSPNFMIAISNNAWFRPSTQPMLQHLIIKYYATKNNTTIYHSVNGSKSEIIAPKKLWIMSFLDALNNN
ncbi:apolipoprotein N-acyltransferase [Campylobacter sputorum]|uniref:apolipoprotein N-acyltransferase n=1 Tax=Campylobacter sputorum TaxID=206 RepID=UPI00068CA6C5|nr:apolipoprotein N-acyltransferase [Campylobacter sputorum]